MADAGRVAIRGKGEWNSVTQYEILDMVTYQDQLYLALDSSKNQQPSLSGDTEFWQLLFKIEEMEGASGTSSGKKGVVPTPIVGDNAKFLRGDATWQDIPLPVDMSGASGSTDGSHGLVPTPHAGDNTKALFGDGLWKEIPVASDMTGASGSSSGTHGLVPAPAAGDQDKVLRGDGTWGDLAGDGTSPEYEWDTSPTTKTHARGDKLWYDGSPYTVLSDMGTTGITLIPTGAGANIELDTVDEGVLASVMRAPEGEEGGIPASGIIYDNRLSGLDAENAQNAIDEVNSKIENFSVDAGDVSYDNTESGLAATDTQGAIDELNSNLYPTLRASGTANTSYISQLTELKTHFSSLTDNEKARAYILNGNVKFPIGNINSGSFYFQSFGATDISIQNLYLSGTCSYSNWTYSSGNWTYADSSSSICSNSLKLYA